MKLLFTQYPPAYFTLSVLGPNILLSTLFSNTVNLRFSFNVRDQFHTHTKYQIDLKLKALVLYTKAV